VSTGNKLPVGERAGGTAASVPAHTEGSGVSLPPPHQSLHAAATHNPELARARTHIHTPPTRHPVKPLTGPPVPHSLWWPTVNLKGRRMSVTITSHETQAANQSSMIGKR